MIPPPHGPGCVRPAQFPPVETRAWAWARPGQATVERIARGTSADVAGYDDLPGHLIIDGGDPVSFAQAEAQALAVLAVIASMREAGLGERR